MSGVEEYSMQAYVYASGYPETAEYRHPWFYRPPKVQGKNNNAAISSETSFRSNWNLRGFRWRCLYDTFMHVFTELGDIIAICRSWTVSYVTKRIVSRAGANPRQKTQMQPRRPDIRVKAERQQRVCHRSPDCRSVVRKIPLTAVSNAQMTREMPSHTQPWALGICLSAPPRKWREKARVSLCRTRGYSEKLQPSRPKTWTPNPSYEQTNCTRHSYKTHL